MNFPIDRLAKAYGKLNTSLPISSDVFEPTTTISNGDTEAKQRAILVEWLNSILPHLKLPTNASDEELRASLIDGTALCRILNRLRPGSVIECRSSTNPSESSIENVKRFLAAMDEMKLPRFQIQDLEKGPIRPVLDCLLTLRAQFMPNVGGFSLSNSSSPKKSGIDANARWKLLIQSPGNGDPSRDDQISPRGYSSTLSLEERRKVVSDSKFQRALRSPIMAEPSAALIHHVGHKFHEVFQLKQGGYADLPAAKITEMMKPNSLDNAPTQSLLSVVNGILDESVERKKGEIPHRVACLLRKVIQEIERRISTQSEHLKTQNNLFKTREEKYQSRIRVLEALATGTGEETEVASKQVQQVKVDQVQQVKTDNTNMEEEKKNEEDAVVRLTKEKEDALVKVTKEKEDALVKVTKEKEDALVKVTQEKEDALVRVTKEKEDAVVRLTKEKDLISKEKDLINQEKDLINQEIMTLKKELEIARKANEISSLQIESEVKGIQQQLSDKLKEATQQLTETRNRIKDLEASSESSRNRVKELEAYSEAKNQSWNKKEHMYQIFTDFQLGALRELKFASQSIKQDVLKTQKGYSDDFVRIGKKFTTLAEASENYYTVLAENRKLHNEVQELKGNIRVYCRVRPFIPGQKGKDSIVHSIGEFGELSVINPSKQGKEALKSFKFNKVYGPKTTQAQVYGDIQPLVRSVLDGYNVCIFAYGQTGSGKTHTMNGPNNATEEDWGVNYRSLNDLFQISQARKRAYTYEVGIQMVEIYNEQVRDLLSSDGAQKKLGIMSTSQPSGLAVPDATMRPVTATSDVMDLMEIGLKNRAMSSTAMNERSSRSHSIVTIHVRGTDTKTGAALRGSLHLVDLAGSERIDRSEVTGDRLKEAQHINKSLSALGDVIFALSQKNSHVPYRNSKLTQVLQASLGGHAKTLMFIQLNPELGSYSESMSTLKFAERVSGVELGAAKSSKEGKDVKDLMDQVASLKDTIAKKDEEIERLQLLKDLKNVYQGGVNGEKRVPGSTR